MGRSSARSRRSTAPERVPETAPALSAWQTAQVRLNRFVVALLAGVLCAAAGCTSSSGDDSGDPQPAGHTHAADGSPATLLVGDGTQAVEVGYRLADVRVPSRAGEPGRVSFKIKRYDGSTVRDYKVEQTKKLHLYVVRTDLAVFRHLHPTMSQDGTWSAALTLPKPGDYRVVAQFVARDEGGNGDHLMLGSTTTVPGRGPANRCPGPATATTARSSVAARGTRGGRQRRAASSWRCATPPADPSTWAAISAAPRTSPASRRAPARRCTCIPWAEPEVEPGGDPAEVPHRVRGARRLPDLRAGAGGRLPAHGPGHGHRPLRGTRKLSEATGFSNSSTRRLTWTRQVPAVGSTTSAR